MPSIDMEPDHRAMVAEILRKLVPGREVRAFGSRVTGKARTYSDLDLVIMGSQPLSLSLLAALRDAFSESDLPFRVDIVDWATTSSTFREIILQAAITLQEMESAP